MTPTYYALRDLSHDPKLAEALGNMVIAWAHAEETLIGTLARVTGIGLNMAQAGFYRLPTFESRIKFIRALINEWKPPEGFDKEEIDKAVTKLSQLAGARNGWVHGCWLRNADKTELFVVDIRAPKDSGRRKRPVKAADVANHVEALKGRDSDLYGLIRMRDLDV